MGNIKKSSTKLKMFILFFIGLVGFIVTAGIYRACCPASFMCSRCGRIYVYDRKKDGITEFKNDMLPDQSAYIIFFVVGCIIAAFVIFAAIRAVMGGIFFTKTVCVAIGAIILCIIFTCLLSREK